MNLNFNCTSRRTEWGRARAFPLLMTQREHLIWLGRDIALALTRVLHFFEKITEKRYLTF